MGSLLIERPIDETIDKLNKDREALERVYMSKQDETSFNSLRAINDKIRCANIYKKIVESRDDFEKIKHLKWKDPNKYIEKCKELVKDVKGINFMKREGLFVVRVQRNGKREYLGAFQSPQDAIEVLNLYIK